MFGDEFVRETFLSIDVAEMRARYLTKAWGPKGEQMRAALPDDSNKKQETLPFVCQIIVGRACATEKTIRPTGGPAPRAVTTSSRPT